MHRITQIAALTLLLLIPSIACADSTQGTINDGNEKIYTFSTAGVQDLNPTLMWKQPHSDLLLVVICGGVGNTLEVTVAAASLDKPRGPLNAQFTAIGKMGCAVAIATIDRSAEFTLAIPGVKLLPAGSFTKESHVDTLTDQARDKIREIRAAQTE